MTMRKHDRQGRTFEWDGRDWRLVPDYRPLRDLKDGDIAIAPDGRSLEWRRGLWVDA